MDYALSIVLATASRKERKNLFGVKFSKFSRRLVDQTGNARERTPEGLRRLSSAVGPRMGATGRKLKDW